MLGKRAPKDLAAEPPLKLILQLGAGPAENGHTVANHTNGVDTVHKLSQLEPELAGEGGGKDWQSSIKKKKEVPKTTGQNIKNKDKAEKKTEEEEREERERAFQKEQEELDKKLAAQENVAIYDSQRLDTKKKRCWERRWVRNLNVRDYSDDIWLTKWVRVSDSKLKATNSKTPYKIEPPKIFKCTYEGCEKVFFDAPSLKKHNSTHGERMFICTVKGCNKKFLDNSKLRRHQVVHTGERPFKCEICGKKFSLDFNLRTHLRTHTGVKPYVCKYPKCGKRFLQSSNLANHEKTHLKEKHNSGSASKNGASSSHGENPSQHNGENGTSVHLEEEGELLDEEGIVDEDMQSHGAAEGMEEDDMEEEPEDEGEDEPEAEDQEVGVEA